MVNKKIIVVGLIAAIVLLVGYSVFSKSKTISDTMSDQEEVMSDLQSELDDDGSEYDLYADVKDFMNKQASYVIN